MKLLTIFLTIFLLISMADANSAPNAPTLIGPVTGAVNKYCTFTVQATDPDGDTLKYTINWGNGKESTSSVRTSGSKLGMMYYWNAAGTYTVKAKATDSKGAVSLWSAPITIVIGGSTPPPNTAPAIPSIPSGVSSGVSGTSYGYSTKATDPDGDRVKYTFDWGDGTESTTSLVNSGASAIASKKWTVAAGSTKTFTVRAKAEDESGAESGWSSTLSVTIAGPVDIPITDNGANQAPYAPYTPVGTMAGYADKTYSYSVYAIDPDDDRVKYTFDWGDGTTSTTSLVSSGTEASASHKWSVPPNTILDFNVRALATDERGTISGWSKVRAIRIHGPVINYPPTIPTKPFGPTSGDSRTSYSYSTKATDPDDGDQIQYVIAWGDGSTTTDYYASGATATASHSWNVPAGLTGTFNVRVMAVDWHGMCSPDPIWSESLRVTITGSPVRSLQAIELQVESDPIVDIQAEADKAINTKAETMEPIDMLTESDMTIDTQNEDGASDTQILNPKSPPI